MPKRTLKSPTERTCESYQTRDGPACVHFRIGQNHETGGRRCHLKQTSPNFLWDKLGLVPCITGPGVWGSPRDEDEAIALLRRAVEKGSPLSTPPTITPRCERNPYCQGALSVSGRADGGHQGRAFASWGDGWVTDCRPEHLRRACADGLKRLKVDCIALYQLHAVDHRVSIEDSLGALVDLQREGEIRRIGVSNVTDRQFARARAVASIVSVQNHYNLRDQSSDRLVDICDETGMAFIPWCPLGAGRVASPNSSVARIAQRHGTTPSQIWLAWLLQRSPAMSPIPGTSSIAHLEENLASASVRPTSDEFRTLASL
jgi:pyridoxine 4-dehydrogenase